jgi:hypothetical protein
MLYETAEPGATEHQDAMHFITSGYAQCERILMLIFGEYALTSSTCFVSWSFLTLIGCHIGT